MAHSNAIKDSLNQLLAVTSSTSILTPDHAPLTSNNFSTVQYNGILDAARRLVQAARDPGEVAWDLALAPCGHAAIRSAHHMGIFACFGGDKGVWSAEEITARTGASQGLVEDRADRLAPDMQKIPDYLASINYRNPGDFENDLSLFSFANQTKLGHWEWLQAHPDLLKVFNERMALTIEVESKESQLDTNPLNVVMKEVARDASPQDVVLVDVGGGHGQVLSHIRTALPDLKGRMVLEDLEETLMGHARQTDVEVVLYDFFTPQPVIGARAYIFRHILHDWPDQKCREILLKTIPALAGSYSRVLIAEIVLPDVYNSQTPKKGTMMDLVMMRVAGKERTESQWRELLGSVGLAVKKVWKGAWQECIIEAVIRTTKEE